MPDKNSDQGQQEWLNSIKSELPLARDVFKNDWANETISSTSVPTVCIPQLAYLKPSPKYINNELNSGERHVRNHFEH